MELDYNDFLSVELDEDVDVAIKLMSPKSNVLSTLSSPAKCSYLEDSGEESSGRSISKKLSTNAP